MAEIKLTGNMKVKTLKAEFKKAFGATLRVYKNVQLRLPQGCSCFIIV